MTHLLTGQWQALQRHARAFDHGLADTDLLPVRTSVGLPRFWPEAERFPQAKLVTPYGLLRLSTEEFAPAYRKRLDRSGVDRIRAELDGIAESYRGRRLVLLCYERDRAECHRGLFAAWYEERTGERIDEWIDDSGNPRGNPGQLGPPAQLSLDLASDQDQGNHDRTEQR